MIRWLRSLVAWRTVFVAGVYAYQENAVTAARRARLVTAGGWSPIDFRWLTRTESCVPPRAPPVEWESGDRTIGPFR